MPGSSAHLHDIHTSLLPFTQVGKIIVCRELPDGFDRHTLSSKFGGKEGGVGFVEMVPDMVSCFFRIN